MKSTKTNTSTGGEPGNVMPPESFSVGIASSEMPCENRIVAQELRAEIAAYTDFEDRYQLVPMTLINDAATALEQSRRVPTLPDVMDDGHEIELRGGLELYLHISGDAFEVLLYRGRTEIGYIRIGEERAFGFDLSNYKVQDGKIVKVEE